MMRRRSEADQPNPPLWPSTAGHDRAGLSLQKPVLQRQLTAISSLASLSTATARTPREDAASVEGRAAASPPKLGFIHRVSPVARGRSTGARRRYAVLPKPPRRHSSRRAFSTFFFGV